MTAALVQPRAGRALDAGRLRPWAGTAGGLAVAGAGLAVAMLPGPAAVLGAAVGIGCGTGLITPLAFATLAGTTPPERMGQTMGSAELGRELGDAGGPLLVGSIAAVGTLALGYGALALLLLAVPLASVARTAARSSVP